MLSNVSCKFMIRFYKTLLSMTTQMELNRLINFIKTPPSKFCIKACRTLVNHCSQLATVILRFILRKLIFAI